MSFLVDWGGKEKFRSSSRAMISCRLFISYEMNVERQSLGA